MARQHSKQFRTIFRVLNRDRLSLFMASLIATIVMALSFYYGKVGFLVVAKRVALTVFIVYPVTFFVVWRVVHVAAEELREHKKEPDEESEDTQSNAGEGA